jgi:uncharacterized protein YcfL
MKHTLASILAAAAVAVLAGCAAPNTTAITATVAPDESGIYQQYLQTDNTRLARQVLLDNVRTDQTANGMLRARLTVTSSRNKTMQLQYKFAWFDGNGIEIDPDAEPWRVLTLEGRDTRPIIGVAPSGAAESFRLRVREADRSKKYIH